jgi:hypothetical protein
MRGVHGAENRPESESGPQCSSLGGIRRLGYWEIEATRTTHEQMTLLRQMGLIDVDFQTMDALCKLLIIRNLEARVGIGLFPSQLRNKYTCFPSVIK